MRQSSLFTKTLRDSPKDEVSINARLLIRGGFISKVMAGVYECMPLGLRVLNSINAIIREEMNAIGAEELHMSVLQNKDTWMKSGRWSAAKEVMYQFQDPGGRDIGLGWTHEEPLTAVAKHFISSYKDLPKAVYQIQTKFRNEPRAKSGMLRGREFLMKDLYSFHADEEDLNRYYEIVARAYEHIFGRVGLDARRTIAAGGLFSKYSDEFQVLSEVGEDTIFYCTECRYAVNIEVVSDFGLKSICPECSGALAQGKSIEVGNIFKLGTAFSEAFDLTYVTGNGDKRPVIMASYGIGPGRVMGAVVEMRHDEKGIMWPDSIAPYSAHLIALGKEKSTHDAAEKLYAALQKSSIEVLYDDRDATAGEKFADADLLGIPYRLVVSEKTIKNREVEVKRRNEEKLNMVKLEDIPKLLLNSRFFTYA